MALIPFIGRVLSHISSAVELVTVNLFYTCEFVPGNASAATSTPTARRPARPGDPACVYNTGTRSGKRSEVLSAPFLKVQLPAGSDPQEPDHFTALYGESARNYVPSATKCQKRSWIVSAPALRILICLRKHGRLTPGVHPLFFPASARTWSWRLRERAGRCGRCHRHRGRSARDSCSLEFPSR